MKRVIREYLDLIEDFELRLQKKYKINSLWDNIGLVFPREGTIDEYSYKFHGAGCKIVFQDIICEYDIAPLNGYDIKFSFWKIYQFYKTNKKLLSIEFTEDRFRDKLLNYLDKGIFSQLDIEGRKFNIYQIENKSYFYD
jgi:hypothetical protein